MANWEDRQWYRVTGGEPLSAIHRRVMDCHDARDNLQAFMAEVGAVDAAGWAQCFGDHRIVGMVFDGNAPDGWKKDKRGDFYTPDKRTKAGKELAHRMVVELSLGRPGEVEKAIEADLVVRGTLGLWPTFARLEGQWFAGIGKPDGTEARNGRTHAEPRYDIEGLEPVSASEVLAAKEREEANEEAA